MPGSVENLFADYEVLAARDRVRWSEDESRSISFYRIDRAFADGEPVTDFPRSQPVLWIVNVREAEVFVTEFGRLPRENNRLPVGVISRRERALADWLRYQRRAATRELLCSYQMGRLETLAGFSWAPHDDLWHRSLDDYEQFVANHRRSPSTRSVDLQERRLAIWASKQRYRHRRGELVEERIRLLETLPIWAWGTR
jgi:hypothetical protein